MNLKPVRCSANAAEPAMMSAEDMVAGAPISHEPLEACLETIIARAGDAGLAKAEVSRRTQFVNHRRRNAALAELIRAGKIVAVRQPTATKPLIVLRLAGTTSEDAPASETA